MVEQKKWTALRQEMQELGLKEEECLEKFILGSGRGGQNLQKTSSCVYLKHQPSGIEVKCQKERSREANRFFARRELCEKFKAQILKIKTEKRQLAEKLRRQKRKRTKRAQEKVLKAKRHQGEIKKLRSSSAHNLE